MREPPGGLKRRIDRRNHEPRRPSSSWGDGAADYSTLRRHWLAVLVALFKREGKMGSAPKGVRFTFTWFEPDRKRDPDGVRAGSKLILDALVKAGVIPNDTAEFVAGFGGDSLIYGAGAGVRVEAVPVDLPGYWGVMVPHRLPDWNEMRAAVELGARRQITAALRYRR